MGPYPNLIQHLVQAINAICGRHYRAGERLPNPGVLSPPAPRLAQAVPPQPEWLTGIRSRVSDDIGEVTVLTANGPIKEIPTSASAKKTPGPAWVDWSVCDIMVPPQSVRLRALAICWYRYSGPSGICKQRQACKADDGRQ